MKIVLRFLNKLYVAIFYSSAFLASLSALLLLFGKFDVLYRSVQMDIVLLVIAGALAILIAYFLGRLLSRYQYWAYRKHHH